jgi:hypothetical protein
MLKYTRFSVCALYLFILQVCKLIYCRSNLINHMNLQCMKAYINFSYVLLHIHFFSTSSTVSSYIFRSYHQQWRTEIVLSLLRQEQFQLHTLGIMIFAIVGARIWDNWGTLWKSDKSLVDWRRTGVSKICVNQEMKEKERQQFSTCLTCTMMIGPPFPYNCACTLVIT